MRLWVSLALASLALAACERATPTQVLVVFEADDAISAVGRRLHIEVTNDEGATRVWDVDLRADQPMATTFPVTLPLVPRDRDASRTYDVVADVVDEAGAVAARQRVRSGYVASELREIRVRFTGDCAGTLCDRGTTCRAARCVDACVRPARRGDPALHACEVPDAGVQPDAGLDETGCDDAHTGALFCDGFEAPLPGAWDDLRETEGVLTRLGAPAYRGAFSLEARTTAGSARVFARSDAIAGVTPDLYVRLYAYVPSGQEIVELNLIYAGEGGAPYGGVVLGIMDGGRVFARGLPAAMQLVTEDTPVAWDRWVCLEAHVAMHATEGSVELWVDDEHRGRLDGIDTFPVTGVAGMNAAIGLTVAEQPPIRVIVDEIVASAARIGCD